MHGPYFSRDTSIPDNPGHHFCSPVLALFNQDGIDDQVRHQKTDHRRNGSVQSLALLQSALALGDSRNGRETCTTRRHPNSLPLPRDPPETTAGGADDDHKGQSGCSDHNATDAGHEGAQFCQETMRTLQGTSSSFSIFYYFSRLLAFSVIPELTR